MLDLDQVPTRPSGSLVGTVVNYAGIGNVDIVFVDGRIKKWDGRLVGIDYDVLAGQAEASRETLLNHYGLSLDRVRFGNVG